MCVCVCVCACVCVCVCVCVCAHFAHMSSKNKKITKWGQWIWNSKKSTNLSQVHLCRHSVHTLHFIGKLKWKKQCVNRHESAPPSPSIHTKTKTKLSKRKFIMCYSAFLQYHSAHHHSLSLQPAPLCFAAACKWKNLPAVQARCKGEQGTPLTVGTIQFEHTHTHSDIHMYTYTVTCGNFKLDTHTHRQRDRKVCVPLITTIPTACIQLLPCLLHKKIVLF